MFSLQLFDVERQLKESEFQVDMVLLRKRRSKFVIQISTKGIYSIPSHGPTVRKVEHITAHGAFQEFYVWERYLIAAAMNIRMRLNRFQDGLSHHRPRRERTLNVNVGIVVVLDRNNILPGQEFFKRST